MSFTPRKKPEEPENHERWLVSYADFITLLFAFFVVLYATSNQNAEKEKQFEKSIREEMKLPMGLGGGPAVVQQVVQGGGPNLQDPFSQKQMAKVDLEEQVEKFVQKQITTDNQKKYIQEVRHDAQGVRIVLAASSFFDSGAYKLRPDSLDVLNQVATLLKQINKKLIIEGHTDNEKIKQGLIESNWELASLRATTVLRYFVAIHGFDPTKMVAMSYSDTRPVAPNDDEADRARNRRIEILISTDDEN